MARQGMSRSSVTGTERNGESCSPVKDTRDTFPSPKGSIDSYLYYRQDQRWNRKVIATKQQIMANLNDR
jgi:hypothetical protein